MNAYWQANPTDISVNAVCRLASVSKPSLYREFGGEDGLTYAALNKYSKEVNLNFYAVLRSGKRLEETLNILTEFVCDNPHMSCGCLFYKMRHSRHRLGPKTQTLLDKLQEEALAEGELFIDTRRKVGDWRETITTQTGARYLFEQIALATTQRALGQDPEQIRATMTLAFSVLKPA